MVFKRTRSIRSKAPSSLSSGSTHTQQTAQQPLSTETSINSCLKKGNKTGSNGSSSSTKHRIRFGQVRIREFERIIGDNPSCSSGAPIGIGWRHSVEKYCTVQEYELAKLQQQTHRHRSAFVLTRHEREQLLLDWGANLQEIVESIRTNVRIKHQRRRTVNNRYDRWEEVMEKASRKIKKTILVGRNNSSSSNGAPGAGTTMGTMPASATYHTSNGDHHHQQQDEQQHQHHHHLPQHVPQHDAEPDQLRYPLPAPAATIDSHFQQESSSVHVPPTRPVQRSESSDVGHLSPPRSPPQHPLMTSAASAPGTQNASPPPRRPETSPPTSPASVSAASRGSSMPYEYASYSPGDDGDDDDGVFALEDYTDSGATSIGTEYYDEDETETECGSSFFVHGGISGSYQYAPPSGIQVVDDGPRPVTRMDSSSSNNTFGPSLMSMIDNSENAETIDGHHLSNSTMEDITDITPSGGDDHEELDDVFLAASPLSGLTSGFGSVAAADPPTTSHDAASTASSNASFPDGNFEYLHRDTSFWEVQRNNADGPCIMRRAVPVTISEDTMMECFPVAAQPKASTREQMMGVPRLVSRWE